MNATTFANYQSHLAGMDESSFIGVMLYYEFRQPRATYADLVGYFTELGLVEDYLPPEIKPVDAYRRATGTDAKMHYDISQDEHVELFVKEVDSDADSVRRHIVRVVRDTKGKKLEYETVGEANYYRASRAAKRKGTGGESVKFNIIDRKLSPDEQVKVRAFVKEMQEDYAFFRIHYYTQAIRDMVRNYVESLNAIKVRGSGSVYFVHRSRWDVINRLVELVNSRIGHGCRIHTVPLIDTEYQRDMLSEAYQDEVEGAVGKLLGRISKVNEKYPQGVPVNKYGRLSEEWNELTERSREYSDIFAAKQDRAGDALDMAMDALMEMTNRLDTE